MNEMTRRDDCSGVLFVEESVIHIVLFVSRGKNVKR